MLIASLPEAAGSTLAIEILVECMVELIIKYHEGNAFAFLEKVEPLTVTWLFNELHQLFQSMCADTLINTHWQTRQSI